MAGRDRENELKQNVPWQLCRGVRCLWFSWNSLLRLPTVRTLEPASNSRRRIHSHGRPKCHVFGVCVDPERDKYVLLYEPCTDKQGFELHLASAHFLDFNEHVKNRIKIREDINFRDDLRSISGRFFAPLTTVCREVH